MIRTTPDVFNADPLLQQNLALAEVNCLVFRWREGAPLQLPQIFTPLLNKRAAKPAERTSIKPRTPAFPPRNRGACYAAHWQNAAWQEAHAIWLGAAKRIWPSPIQKIVIFSMSDMETFDTRFNGGVYRTCDLLAHCSNLGPLAGAAEPLGIGHRGAPPLVARRVHRALCRSCMMNNLKHTL
jgi:hypothetical protein